MKNYTKLFLFLVFAIFAFTACSSASIEQISTEIQLTSNNVDSNELIKNCLSAPSGEEIIIVESNLNCSKTGSYQVSVATQKKPEKTYTFDFSVVDTIAPTVQLKEGCELEVNEGANLSEIVHEWDSFIELADNAPVEEIVLEWDFSNINTAIAGTYSIECLVTDIAGNMSSTTFEITVTENWEEYEIIAAKLIQNLKNILKNPDSIQVHSISCRRFFDYEKTYHYKVDFSAQNGFGGMNRETYYIETMNGSFGKNDLDSLIMIMEQSNYNNNPYILAVALDVNKIMQKVS